MKELCFYLEETRIVGVKGFKKFEFEKKILGQVFCGSPVLDTGL